MDWRGISVFSMVSMAFRGNTVQLVEAMAKSRLGRIFLGHVFTVRWTVGKFIKEPMAKKRKLNPVFVLLWPR
jgi:hypothetical protein